MGFEKSGHECVYSIEWDKHKRRIYSVIFGKEPEGKDIRTICGNELPRSDCWCFGFPCQDISVAGKQLGFNGDRSSMFFEVMRLLSEIEERNKPSYLFIENVKNLISVNEGWDFFNLLYSLDLAGYDAEWQLLNSKNFGVPQNRERVFIIGHLRGRSTRKIFPITGTNQPIGVPIKRLAHANNFRRYNQTYDINSSIEALDTCQGGGRQPCVKIVGNTNPSGNSMNGQVYDSKGLAPTLTTNKGEGNKILVRAVLTPDRIEKRQNGRRFKEPGEPMFTLTKQDIHGVAIKEATKKGYAIAEEGDSINLEQPNSKTRRGRVGKGIANTLTTSCNQTVLKGFRVRKLTPKECWRLQGIKDKITEKVIAAGISNSQMYIGSGDATTVNVIYEIANRLV